ncbi:hypothetical protein NDU88_006906 [Pleurodeles waltl]|uniref:Uncharacterized protein n=1 Tax=Pleurodeles waltl TaxID=8319 RepID=A0AAV7PJR6_PLEWA|nr:hypothetical protein NDU88_006906 [Pleurodeles waltl]
MFGPDFVYYSHKEKGDTVLTLQYNDLGTHDSMMVHPKGSKTGDTQQTLTLPEAGTSLTGLHLNTDHMLQDTNSKLAELLTAVLDLRATLEPKCDTLIIDMRLMREQHNRLKARVSAHDVTITEM